MKGKTEKRAKQHIINYENKCLPVYYFIPLLLIAGFVPLITYAKYLDLSGTTQALYWTGQQQYLDFFSYWKSRWIIVLTAIALIVYIILYRQKKLPFKDLKQYYIPLGVYAIFVFISTIFAIDTQTAMWGFIDMYQGIFVLISYVLITFLTINYINNSRDVSLFVKAFLFLMIVEGLIGVGQYFGLDLFQTISGKNLILPNNLIVEGLSFSFGPKTIYGTLFNTNFVGSFATLMLPLSVAFLLSAKTKNHKLMSGISVLLMMFIWLGCNSRAGYLGVVISSIFAIWLFRKAIRKYWKVFASLFIIIVLTIVGLNVTSDGALFDRLQSFNIIKQVEELENTNKYNIIFEEINLGKDTFYIKTNLETLKFKIDGEKLYFLDENNNELEVSLKGNLIEIKSPRFSEYRIEIPKNYPGVSVSRSTYWYWMNTNFYFSKDGVKILGSGGKLSEPIKAERFEPLDGYENFMSNRGYIWSRTIPMLNEYIFKGAGADNFPIAFPQDDFIAKLNAGLDANTVIDKPHNMYLQIATNTGVISLVALLALWGTYIINSLKLYSRITYSTLDTYVGASCLISIIGYLVSGMFNDQIVSVAPLFWLILGLGISINLRLKSNIALDEKDKVI